MLCLRLLFSQLQFHLTSSGRSVNVVPTILAKTLAVPTALWTLSFLFSFGLSYCRALFCNMGTTISGCSMGSGNMGLGSHGCNMGLKHMAQQKNFSVPNMHLGLVGSRE
jgi:hypothetical protein